MNITQIAELTAAAKEAVEKVDHQAEYNKLMRQSAAHQRIADGLAQSHQEEDYPLYTEHAGKAWRLGNKAMEHFKRMTKEERAMLKKQSWDGMQQPQPGRASFGNKQKQFMKGMAAYATTETIKKNWDVRADWAEFDQQREAAGKTRGGVADLARRQARQGKFEQKMMHRVLTREGWRQATKADLANPVVKKAVDDANDGNQNRIWNKYLQRGVSPSTRVYTSDSRPNEVITTNKYGSAYGQHNWMHSKLYQPGDVQNPNIHISPIYRSTSGGGQESLYKHLRGGAPPEALGFSGAKKVQADWTQFDDERSKNGKGGKQNSELMKNHAFLLNNGFTRGKTTSGYAEYIHPKRDGKVILYPHGEWEHENSNGETVSLGKSNAGLQTHYSGMTSYPMTALKDQTFFGASIERRLHEIERRIEAD